MSNFTSCSACPTCGSRHLPCGCCDGIETLTPVPIFNRPGLDSLAYRVGTHGSFMASMMARLATVEFDSDAANDQAEQRARPLQALTTRDTSDFSIALLDGWAVVADLLSFYQERIANEGYLRCASERRSVLELAGLVGYKLRPGVAASVYLAYTLDDNQLEPTIVAAGARSQSLPGPGESPQAFETSEDLEARREWNNLQVRLQRPQDITLANVLSIERISVSDSVNSLQVGDTLLLLFSDDGQMAALRKVRSTEGPAADGHSVIWLNPVADELGATVEQLVRLVTEMQPHLPDATGATRRAIERAQSLLRNALLDHAGEPDNWAGQMLSAADGSVASHISSLIGAFSNEVNEILATLDEAPAPEVSSPDLFVHGLLQPHVPQAANSMQLRRDLGHAFGPGADSVPQMLLRVAPPLRDSYYQAWAGARVNAALPPLRGVFTLLTGAPLFGASVPRQATYDDNGAVRPPSQWLEWTLDNEQTDGLFLEQLSAPISSDGFAVVSHLEGSLASSQVMRIVQAGPAQRAAYGISGKATHLRFDRDWWQARQRTDMSVLRSTLVQAQGESLTLVDEPVTHDLGGQEIELAALHQDLQSGRWVIVDGERADIAGVDGVRAAELMMVSGLVHGYDPTLAGDTTLTTLQLATPMAYVYKRESVVVYGNVVQATHGETREELLGSGDATENWLTFSVKQPPLTFVSAPTAAGAESTLAVHVDELQWHETRSLAWLGAKDRGFISQTDDDGVTSVTFGDGANGARLPTGVQNVRAVYRTGIGAQGNVQANQVSLLTTRPLGVKEVINPLRASGGADREGRDLARENAPLAVKALDRLVSVADYADFARTFAGVSKALATRTNDGARELVFLTIAGANDVPIDKTSDLYRNLLLALRQLGDPDLPLRIEVRELHTLVLSAGVALQPDHVWESVVAAVRAQLLDAFGFERRGLGQSTRLCEVIAAVQSVPGVAWVDIDVFTSIPEKTVDESGTRTLISQAEISQRIAAALDPPVFEMQCRRSNSRLPPDIHVFPGGIDAGVLRPAELATFTPAIADTLILNQLP